MASFTPEDTPTPPSLDTGIGTRNAYPTSAAFPDDVTVESIQTETGNDTAAPISYVLSSGTDDPIIDFTNEIGDVFQEFPHEIQVKGDTLRVDVYAEPIPLPTPDEEYPLRETPFKANSTGEKSQSLREKSRSLRKKYPITNAVMFGLTISTTLLAGARWYGVTDTNLGALTTIWPFAASVLLVLGTHELGHYLTSRYYGVDATLPYFIPMPNLLGTLGAVIRMESDSIPNRKTLFDIAVAGPLAGLVMTVVVAVIGLQLPPVTQTSVSFGVDLNYPPFIQAIAWLLGEQTAYAGDKMPNPVLVGAWAGSFITFLNLLPVGQLDGGHMMRALIGKRQRRLQYVVPLTLVLLGIAVTLLLPGPGIVWIVWAVLTTAMVLGGTAEPAKETPLGRRRILIGVATFALGAVCFVPVPVSLIS